MTSIASCVLLDRIHIDRFSSRHPWLIDYVISTIDIDRITGDEPGYVVGQERRCRADVFNAYQTSRRRLGLCLVQQLVELRNA